MADVLGVPVHRRRHREQRARRRDLCRGGRRDLRQPARAAGSLRAYAATYQPSGTADYDERYHAWREIYRRMLDITEDGLLRPLWRAAGT